MNMTWIGNESDMNKKWLAIKAPNLYLLPPLLITFWKTLEMKGTKIE